MDSIFQVCRRFGHDSPSHFCWRYGAKFWDHIFCGAMWSFLFSGLVPHLSSIGSSTTLVETRQDVQDISIMKEGFTIATFNGFWWLLLAHCITLWGTRLVFHTLRLHAISTPPAVWLWEPPFPCLLAHICTWYPPPPHNSDQLSLTGSLVTLLQVLFSIHLPGENINLFIEKLFTRNLLRFGKPLTFCDDKWTNFHTNRHKKF